MPEKRTHAGLQYFVFEPKTYEKTVFLLHGYGASAPDLMPLKDVGGLETLGYRWVFIQAPQPVPISTYEQGWAWFTLDMDRLVRLTQMGDVEGMGAWAPEGIKPVARKVSEVVSLECPVAEKRILGGFSQGSMVSLQAVLDGLKVNALVLLSSSWIDAKGWTQAIEKLSQEKQLPKIFQSHGRYDPVLPYGAAEHLHSVLKKNAAPIEFHSFMGQHEIPMDVLNKLAAFLKRS